MIISTASVCSDRLTNITNSAIYDFVLLAYVVGGFNVC